LLFYNAPFTTAPELLPSYLDIAYYRKARGIPFTVNSNLVYALSAALDFFSQRTYELIEKDGVVLREALQVLGLPVVAPEAIASPAVTTLVLPPEVSSVAIGDQLAAHGFLLSYQSRYLVERNWIQICLMGDYRMDVLPTLLQMLGEMVAIQRRVAV
jgi:aspartate aminotransferase-like enzyme